MYIKGEKDLFAGSHALGWRESERNYPEGCKQDVGPKSQGGTVLHVWVGKNNVALSFAAVCNHDDVDAYLKPVTIVIDLMGGQLARSIGPEEKNIGTFLGCYQQVSKAQP